MNSFFKDFLESLAPQVPDQPSEFRGAPVTASHDLTRIKNLPTRTPVDAAALVQKWNGILRKPDAPCDCVKRFGYCINSLKPIQATALEEAASQGGLLAPIGVGHGKTGIDLLLAMALNVRVAMLLVPSNLKPQLLGRDYPQWSVHFKTPNIAGMSGLVPGRPTLYVVTYSELSSQKNSDLLSRLNPELIIADEAHNLKDRKAARTRRFLRQVNESKTKFKFCALSGTLTSRSLRDFAHLSSTALNEGSPLPLEWPVVEEWAAALDPSETPAPPGMLRSVFGDDVRKGFSERLVSTPGVVATDAASVGASVYVLDKKVKVPKALADIIREVRETGTRPDGEEADEAMRVAEWTRQLACGFYYRWKFPRGESPAQIDLWLQRRAAYNKEVRERLKRPKEHFDSPGLLYNAAERASKGYKGPLPVWHSVHWAPWVAVKDTVEHETEAVWLDDYLLKDAAQWAAENTGIVWYDFREFGDKLAKLTGLPRFGGGEKAGYAIQQERGDRSIIASIDSHCTGKNLQMFSTQLVTTPPADGAKWEQLIGRTHREGQKADEVFVHLYRHTDEYKSSFEAAVRRAWYIQGTLQGAQRLCFASLDFDV